MFVFFVSVFARLFDFADSLGLTALDTPFGTEVRFLTFLFSVLSLPFNTENQYLKTISKV